MRVENEKLPVPGGGCASGIRPRELVRFRGKVAAGYEDRRARQPSSLRNPSAVWKSTAIGAGHHSPGSSSSLLPEEFQPLRWSAAPRTGPTTGTTIASPVAGLVLGEGCIPADQGQQEHQQKRDELRSHVHTSSLF